MGPDILERAGHSIRQRRRKKRAGLTAYVFREKRPGSRLTITIRQFGDGSPSPERELVLTVK